MAKTNVEYQYIHLVHYTLDTFTPTLSTDSIVIKLGLVINPVKALGHWLNRI